ncbi:hypothetical protein BCV69DRAFT_301899 [Microstroma glucosiphilum]|uniref:Uncharacterized protein n=1 Tax=Pseudomicrostroma glucosiphilum TaxID=1684307 RepID=A0A316U458_9BASI|nr:hypothetical protein BCV69DRAFT_301899 [Pseudomicrostroma glucosiphilum]PWN17715.1 hypothetical protein BCV69DRAFT_301899 [Pseudomicrostroma glucosiphilum]
MSSPSNGSPSSDAALLPRERRKKSSFRNLLNFLFCMPKFNKRHDQASSPSTTPPARAVAISAVSELVLTPPARARRPVVRPSLSDPPPMRALDAFRVDVGLSESPLRVRMPSSPGVEATDIDELATHDLRMEQNINRQTFDIHTNHDSELASSFGLLPSVLLPSQVQHAPNPLLDMVLETGRRRHLRRPPTRRGAANPGGPAASSEDGPLVIFSNTTEQRDGTVEMTPPETPVLRPRRRVDAMRGGASGT